MFWIILSILQNIPVLDFHALNIALPSANDIAVFWETLHPATCMPERCFCEPVQFGLIRQPINTITNIGFIFAGAMVSLIAAYDYFLNPQQRKTNLMRSHWIYPVIYGYSAVIVGLGSMIYHSTMTFFGQSLDILGMYLLAIFMIVYNIARILNLKTKYFLFWFLLVNAGLWTIATIAPVYRRPLFIVMLVVILISDVFVRSAAKQAAANNKYYAASIASMLIGCGAWILDIQNIGCMPNSLFQLHSLWHIGMAGAIFFLYLYYRSEGNLTPAASKIENSAREASAY